MAKRSSTVAFTLVCTIFFIIMHAANTHSKTLSWAKLPTTTMEKELVTAYGEGQRVRAPRGIEQVLNYWRDEDGVLVHRI
jgi:hypothetical protein